jgi:Fe-Mn family superoxide dismutase
MKFELPKLPYNFNALEPFIDAQTMEIHLTKHHAAYVNNLNAALEKFPELSEKGLEELLTNLQTLPEEIRNAVKNNGGGHYNHTQYWNILGPNGGGEPSGQMADDIKNNFGSFSAFKENMNKTGLARFGSGWVWLVRKPDGKLEITSTPNQDTPLADGNTPVLGIDVWEHAYYLKYQNKRADYLESIWNVIVWENIK